MSIKVDQALCSGCGLCVELCPEVFSWGSEGKAVVKKQESADQCPMEAIEI